MTKIDGQNMIAYLKDKWEGRRCPMCGKGNWSVQDTVYEIREFNEGSFVVGGPVIPVVPIVCTNCGNTVFLNAIISKALESQKEGGKK